jgi:hypothetical protein
MINESTLFRQFRQKNGCTKQALQGGVLCLYDGVQPTDPDVAPNGNLLVTFTQSSGAHTAETLAIGSVTLTGGSSGSVNQVTVNSEPLLASAVSYSSSLAQTALNLIDAINDQTFRHGYVASSGGTAVVTLTAPIGSGALVNSFVVTASLTTITASYGNMSGGVTAVNGLTFGESVAGVLSGNGTWSGVAVATGVPASYRFARSAADAASATPSGPRIDGSVSSSGADLNFTPNQAVSGVTMTITASSFQYTEPA